MKAQAKPSDPRSVFCEVCLKRVPKPEALVSETRDATQYFCGAACYERWLGARPPEAQPPEIQEGAGHSKSRDERVKRLIRRHPQRDEPKTE